MFSDTENYSFSKKIISSAVFLLLICQSMLIPATAQIKSELTSPQISTTVVISEFRVRGPNGASDELLELYNLTANPVNIGGWKINGSSSGGIAQLRVTVAANTIIPAYGHFLMTNSGYNGSIAGDQSLNPNNGVSDEGGIALLNASDVIIDQVGLSAGSAYKEGTPLASLGSTNSDHCYERKAGGNAGNAQDTDNNSNDFQLITPCLPQNLASAPTPPTGSVNLSGSGAANPSSVASGSTTLLTVTVNPGTEPPSTGITVTGNLSSIGGSAAQTFFDDGTNGDSVAGNNVFSYLATIPANASSGSRILPVTITDAQSRTASASISLTVNGVADAQEHLLMGNPSSATADVSNELNYLLSKPQYALSYHRTRAIPNWTSWHLDSSWLGSTTRQDDFRPDPTLPSGWYQVTPADYSNSGFTRGHHTPSGDRTNSIPDNSATFLMTNMMPQSAGNNNGPWEKLESASRAIVGQGNELYIVAAGVGTGGIGTSGTVTNTISGGKVTVPAYTWKVILVLPVGNNDVSRVDANTRTIAVIMPNIDSISAEGWQKYLATVDQVEALTGYDFFSNVPVSIQNVIESRVDAASQNASPQTVSGGTYTNLDVTSTPNKTLTGNVTVTGNLNLGGTNLATSNFCVTLGATATVTRTYGYVNGCVEKQFTSTQTIKSTGISSNSVSKNVIDNNAPQATFEYPVGTENGFSPVTANITALGQSPSSLTVKTVQGAQPNVPDPNLAIKRYWTLTENGDLTADLTFKYLDIDVPTGISENSLTLQRYENSFTQIPATIDAAANTATTTGITQFSDWTLFAPLGTTAAGVDISGRVTSFTGRSVAGATIVFTNQNGDVITAKTNPFGYYRLADVPAGITYVVDVRHKTYRFTPQVVNLSDNLDGLDFVGFFGN